MKGKLRLVINVTRDKRVHRILEQTIAANKTVSAMFDRFYVMSKAELVRRIETADVLFSFAVPGEAIARAENLKWIHFASAGVEKSLAPLLKPTRIKLSCSRGIHAAAIAEYVFMQILAFSKNLRKAYQFQDRRQWQFEAVADGKFDLENKTICVVGLGSIGSRVVRLAKAFNMRVIGTVGSLRRMAGVDRVYPPSGLAECLRQSDFVVLTVPLTEKTFHLIGRKELRLMKKNAFLVNISRGKVINERALIEALQQKRIAGAALDVFEMEPLSSNSPLWKMDNVAVTPHYSGMAENLWEKVALRFCENAIRFKGGRKLLGVVSRRKGY